MQRAGWLFPTVISFVSLTFACRDPGPLGALPLAAVQAVVLEGPPAGRRELRDSQDVAFVLRHLQGLARYRTAKVSPDYYVTILPSSGPPLRLRLGVDQVGPDVPADAVVDRWRLADSTLYRFVETRLSGK